jgi:hypothetical protein
VGFPFNNLDIHYFTEGLTEYFSNSHLASMDLYSDNLFIRLPVFLFAKRRNVIMSGYCWNCCVRFSY